MSEHQRRSQQHADQGSATRPQVKSARAPRSDIPRRLMSTSLAGLPRAIWQAGNAAIGRLLGRRSGGQPLEARTRAEMEQAFGTDFGDVRLHDDAAAQATAGALGAQALTHGDNVY